MGREADHISLANRNHDALIHLMRDLDKYSEWITVVAFYKALQIIEAVFVHTHGKCAHGHHGRLQGLKSRGYTILYKHFRSLWEASCVARYLCGPSSDSPREYSCFADYLTPQKVKQTMVKRRLHGVECEAVALLSEDGRKALKRLPDDL